MTAVASEPIPVKLKKVSSVNQTPEQVRSRMLPERRRRAIRPALVSLVVSGVIWLMLTVGLVFAPWYLQIPLGIINGLYIAVLFVVGHDAAHGALFPRRWMNRFAARLALLPALHPLSSWIHSHNRQHHAFTNIREKDSSLPPLDLAEYRSRSAVGRWVTRRCRTWYGIGLHYFLDIWWKWEFAPSRNRAPKNPKAFRRDRLLVILFAVVWLTALSAAVNFDPLLTIPQVLLGFVLPQFIWNWFIGFIIFQQHTHPRVPWYSKLDAPNPTFFMMQVQATPYLLFPPPFRKLMLHIMEHTAHHTDPLVPHYHLHDAQQELQRSFRTEMVRVIWRPKMFLETMRLCRIYDYEQHRWCDYDGTPTTAQLVKRVPAE